MKHDDHIDQICVRVDYPSPAYAEARFELRKDASTETGMMFGEMAGKCDDQSFSSLTGLVGYYQHYPLVWLPCSPSISDLHLTEHISKQQIEQ